MVTGSAGFIGRNLCNQLVSEGYEVIGSDFRLNKSDPWLNIPPAEFSEFISKLPIPIRDLAIVHCGARADATTPNTETLEYENITITKELMDVAAKHTIPYIFFSSAAVYGTNPSNRLTISRLSPYAGSKLLGEQYLSQLQKASKNWRAISLRLFNCYGAGELHKGKMISIPTKFYLDARDNRRIEIWKVSDSIDQSRDFISVKSVCYAICSLIASEHFENGTYDLGTGTNVPFTVVAKLVKSKIPCEIVIVPLPSQVNLESYQTFTRADLQGLAKLIDVSKFENFEIGFTEHMKSLMSRQGGNPDNLFW